MADADDLKQSPLAAVHRDAGARMVPFAGWEMPLQYAGIMAEHIHTRTKASLFDVSHMAPFLIQSLDDDMERAALALEAMIPVDIVGLAEGRQRYGFFTNKDGGIIDDLMIANRGDHYYIVANAAHAYEVWCHIADHVEKPVIAGPLSSRAMIALQGPLAVGILEQVMPGVSELKFLDIAELEIGGTKVVVSRSGYTGEDGVEISMASDVAEDIVRFLLEHPDIEPAGLGARDSLRLEAGLCLYGNDIDAGTSPVEAGLKWAIQKVRRTGGDREGGFPGAERILRELSDGPSRHLVGLRADGRAPVRGGSSLHASADGDAIGTVTSGVFGPSVEGPVAMGYVADGHHLPGTSLFAEVRGKRLPVTVTKLPFVQTNYKR